MNVSWELPDTSESEREKQLPLLDDAWSDESLLVEVERLGLAGHLRSFTPPLDIPSATATTATVKVDLEALLGHKEPLSSTYLDLFARTVDRVSNSEIDAVIAALQDTPADKQKRQDSKGAMRVQWEGWSS